MENWLEFIEPLALAGTMLITIVNLFTTNTLTRLQQQSNTMSTMRSGRIESMREHSAGVITCCECLLNDLAEDDTKRDLLFHSHSLISLLQYHREYVEDVALIKSTHKIIGLCLADELNKAELSDEVKKFWWMCNVYIGADFERLKNESLGKIHRGGQSKEEATDFHSLYNNLNATEIDLFPEVNTLESSKK